MPNDREDYSKTAPGGEMWNFRGAISSYDLSQDAMTLDGAFHDWDISSIVPVGTKLVVIGGRIVDAETGLYCWIQTKGFGSNINAGVWATQEAAKSLYDQYLFSVDPTTRLLEYVTSGVPIAIINLYVAAWLT